MSGTEVFKGTPVLLRSLCKANIGSKRCVDSANATWVTSVHAMGLRSDIAGKFAGWRVGAPVRIQLKGSLLIQLKRSRFAAACSVTLHHPQDHKSRTNELYSYICSPQWCLPRHLHAESNLSIKQLISQAVSFSCGRADVGQMSSFSFLMESSFLRCSIVQLSTGG